jgi:carboxylesterase
MSPSPSHRSDPPSNIHNPHFDGSEFFWERGSTGILLIHGLTATTVEVQSLGRILHQRGYTISGPLLPGHYTTPEDLNQTHWQDWVAKVEHSYQELAHRCTTVFVGGESTGGLLALYLAIEHPEVAGILTYAPGIRLIMSNWDMIRLYLAAPWISSAPKGSLDSSESWQGYLVNPLKSAIELLKLQKIVRNRLARIHQPTLIVQGRLDTTVHPLAPQEIYNQISSDVKEIHWMDNSAHVVIIDKELESVAEISLAFIQKTLS